MIYRFKIKIKRKTKKSIFKNSFKINNQNKSVSKTNPDKLTIRLKSNLIIE